MSAGRPPVLDDRTVERLLTGHSAPADPELQHALGLVRSMGSGPAPRPTAALAELLVTGFAPEAAPLRRPTLRRRWSVRAAAGLTAAAASLLVAGTAQALPAPVQDGLAGVVRALTPFELPSARPSDGSTTHPPEPATGTGPTSDEPAPTQAPSGPDSGAAAPAPGEDGGTGAGPDATDGERAGSPGTGSTVPAPGRDRDRPSPPGVDRDEQRSTAPEARVARPEVGRPPATGGSPGNTPARPVAPRSTGAAATSQPEDTPAAGDAAASPGRGREDAGRGAPRASASEDVQP